MATLPQLGPRRIARPTRQIASYDPGREGAAIEGLGNTMLKAGEEMAQRQQQEQDAQAVFAARRQIDDWERSTLYDSQNGAVAKMGRDAFELPTTVPKAFDDFSSKLMESPMSTRARQAVQEMLVSRRDQALNFVDRHTFQQRQVFEEGQVNADIDSSLNRAALLTDAGDLATARVETQLAQTRAVGFLKSRGKSEEEISAKVRDISSRAAVTTINMLLEKDKPTEAEKFLRDNASAMKVEDMLRSQAAVGKAVDARQGLVIAQGVVDATLKPAVQPTDFGRLANLAGPVNMGKLTVAVKQTESGGRRYGQDGKLLTSAKGAEGEMQVMKGTQRDPGYGVTPAKDDSADEIARVGRDYLAAMVREFKGDIPKALAAYNGGPGAVQKALEQAAKGRSGSVDWLSYMPPETQAYVTKVTKSYGDGGGAPQMPTLAAMHDQVRAMVPPDQPQRRKIALDEVTRQYEEMLKARKQQEDENTSRGYKWLAENGGRFSQMPAGIRANIPPKEFDNLTAYGQKVAKGDDITDPIVFQRMATDDAWLKGLTDAQFYMHSRKLSQADAEQMALRRGKLLNGEIGAKGPNDLDTAGVNAILNNRLQQMGRDPTPKDGSGEAQTVGAIRKFVWDSVLQAQRAAGKRFNDAELGTAIDKLFATNVKFQTSFLGIDTGTKSQRLLSMTPSDIPGDVKNRLKSDFKKAGISDPTDADLLGAYLQLRASR